MMQVLTIKISACLYLQSFTKIVKAFAGNSYFNERIMWFSPMFEEEMEAASKKSVFKEIGP